MKNDSTRLFPVNCDCRASNYDLQRIILLLLKLVSIQPTGENSVRLENYCSKENCYKTICLCVCVCASSVSGTTY